MRTHDGCFESNEDILGLTSQMNLILLLADNYTGTEHRRAPTIIQSISRFGGRSIKIPLQ